MLLFNGHLETSFSFSVPVSYVFPSLDMPFRQSIGKLSLVILHWHILVVWLTWSRWIRNLLFPSAPSGLALNNARFLLWILTDMLLYRSHSYFSVICVLHVLSMSYSNVTYLCVIGVLHKNLTSHHYWLFQWKAFRYARPSCCLARFTTCPEEHNMLPPCSFLSKWTYLLISSIALA